MAEIVGQWWFEGDEQRTPGTLKLESNQIELHLNHGPVTNHIWNRSRRKRGDILGESSTASRISLLDCVELEVFQSQGNRYMISRFRCSEAFVGIHQTTKNPSHFDLIVVSLDLGARWIEQRPYDAKSRHDDGIDHQFAIYFDTRQQLFEQQTPNGSLEFFFSNLPDFLAHEFSLKSAFLVSMSDTSQPKTYGEWREALEPYRWLVSLLLGRTTRIDSVSLTAGTNGQGVDRVSVIPPFLPDERKNKSFRPGLTFAELRLELSDLLTRWRSVAAKYAQACELLVAEETHSDFPVRFNFLLHIQVLESIYRRGIFQTETGKLLKDFDSVQSELLKVIQSTDNSEFITTATGRISNLNELSLRSQIDRFLSTFNDATVEAIGLDKSTAGEIAKIRHEITHALSRGNTGSPTAPIEIYMHTYRLRFLVFIYLLKEAGLNERDCVYGLGASDEFRGLVDFDAFNHPKHSWLPEDYGHAVTGRFMKPTPTE